MEDVFIGLFVIGQSRTEIRLRMQKPPREELLFLKM